MYRTSHAMQKQPSRPERTERRTGLLARVRAHLQTRSRGQSLVEFGLILPVFLVLLATTLDLGRLAMARVTVTNAAREGAFQASETPTSFNSAQPCPAGAATNKIVCRVQLEAKSSGISIAPSDIAVSCDTAGCPQQVPSRVTVTVTGHFTLLTPILAVFFGNSQNITFTAASTTQIDALPPAPSGGGGASPTPTPTPNPSATPTPTPSPTPAVCNLPSAGFTTNPSDTSNVDAPFTLQVTDSSTSPNCAIQSWLWDWGDGTTTLGQGPWTHSYIAKGNYKVTLKVTNATGSNTTGGQIVHTK
jgi:Flp pilus assembly protein TadG